MTGQKVKTIFQLYLEHLNAAHPGIVRQMTEAQTKELSRGINFENEVSHLKYICVKAQEFVEEGRIEKAMRWLGFIQGVLWSRGYYTLDQLKNHSRPDSVEPE